MKYVVSLIVGMALGVTIFFALLYYNPLTSQNKLSPLSVSDNDVILGGCERCPGIHQ
jgi:hypothetical protein